MLLPTHLEKLHSNNYSLIKYAVNKTGGIILQLQKHRTNKNHIKIHTFLLISYFCIFAPTLSYSIDFTGSLKTATITDVNSEHAPPVASFTYSIEGNTVSLDASGSTAPDGEIVQYNWLFNENSHKTGQTTTSDLSTILNKQVTLTVIDNFNGISLTQSTIRETNCGSTPFYSTATPATNSYKTGSDSYYAFSGGIWAGNNNTLCGIQFYISAKVGNISSKNFTIKIFSTDANNNLQTLKGTSEIISGSTLNTGWTKTIHFSPSITIAAGDAIVFTEVNNALDSSNFIILAENRTENGNLNEGIWGSDLVNRRLWKRAVLIKLYE